MQESRGDSPYQPLDIAREVVELILSRISPNGTDRADQAITVLNIALAMKPNFGMRLRGLDQAK